MDVAVSGICQPGYERISDIFKRLLEEKEEVGVAFSVVRNGEMVVDLWGGFYSRDRTRLWERDTILNTQSVIKSVYSITAMHLFDEGLLDLDQPVAHWWPEFGQAGKENLTVSQLLSHMSALAFPDHARVGDAFSWERMIRALEKQEPSWMPGVRGIYHSSTYGYLVGELINRCSGMWAGDYFREKIGKPFGIDYHFRMDDALWKRTSPLIYEKKGFSELISENEYLTRAWHYLPEPESVWNNKDFSSAKTICGYGNARSLARLFGAIAADGMLEGRALLSPRAVRSLTEEQWVRTCDLLGAPIRMCRGLFMSTPGFPHMGPPDNFGGFGMGGFAGVGDPVNRLGIGYTGNNMFFESYDNPRFLALLNALYDCL